jgi:hypothetical protein
MYYYYFSNVLQCPSGSPRRACAAHVKFPDSTDENFKYLLNLVGTDGTAVYTYSCVCDTHTALVLRPSDIIVVLLGIHIY